MDFKQEYRRLGINTPLGADALVLHRLEGIEEISRPFHYRLRLLSEQADIDPAQIVGKNVTIVMMDPDDQPNYINGYVQHWVNHGHGDRASVYSAEIVPWLWFLTRRSDCRIFQDMSVPKIIEEVFATAGFKDYEIAGLKGTYDKREYCVQYCESDFNFVSRLLEEEGIFYYFRHTADKHFLVLGDDPAAYTDARDKEVRFMGPLSFDEVDDNLTAWEHRYAFRTGKYALTDYNFETSPQDPLLAKERTVVKLPGVSDFEFYEYPGVFPDPEAGKQRARRRMEAEELEHDRVIGASKCRSFGPGRKISVSEHHVESEKGKSYVLTRVVHSVSAGSFVSGGDEPEAYGNEFEAIPAATPFRPARVTARTRITGPQTALVVGPQGEEIYTDEYGRVKVKFHWDRTETMDDKASCWIRCTQDIAGKNWGAMWIPRIGQEVVVDFLEGDPDRPIITGRVYNAYTMPPYELPGNKHLSGVKTNSTKGGAGFNELRFDDTKGEEQVFLHAEHNSDTRVKNDCFEWIGNNRHLIVKNNQYDHVEVDRHTKIGNNTIDEVGVDRNLKVKGKQAVDIGGSASWKVGADVIEVFQANQSTQITGNLYIKAAGVVIEAMTGLTLKCGGNSVVIDPAGVTVKGMSVVLDGVMTRINSGPGSPPTPGMAGSLVGPLTVEAAQEADDADPGEVAKVKARQKELNTGKYGATPAPVFKPKPPEQQDPTKTAWIEIELVDEADRPVPGEKYRIILPDGQTVASGTLDENGRARAEGFDPGTCQITFTELDGRTWESA